uniref:(northern house mosquito) hypothetical protein n=1 Tax=Culex pipiens TaxID=7175 RepID=A0A8D8F2W6_CULPI
MCADLMWTAQISTLLLDGQQQRLRQQPERSAELPKLQRSQGLSEEIGYHPVRRTVLQRNLLRDAQFQKACPQDYSSSKGENKAGRRASVSWVAGPVCIRVPN